MVPSACTEAGAAARHNGNVLVKVDLCLPRSALNLSLMHLNNPIGNSQTQPCPFADQPGGEETCSRPPGSGDRRRLTKKGGGI